VVCQEEGDQGVHVLRGREDTDPAVDEKSSREEVSDSTHTSNVIAPSDESAAANWIVAWRMGLL